MGRAGYALSPGSLHPAPPDRGLSPRDRPHTGQPPVAMVTVSPEDAAAAMLNFPRMLTEIRQSHVIILVSSSGWPRLLKPKLTGQTEAAREMIDSSSVTPSVSDWLFLLGAVLANLIKGIRLILFPTHEFTQVQVSGRRVSFNQ